MDDLDDLILGSEEYRQALKMNAQEEQTLPSQAFKSALVKTSRMQQTISSENPFKFAVKEMALLSPLDVYTQPLSSKATDNLRTKRIRPWDTCDDVQELKRMLVEKDEQLLKLQNELSSTRNAKSSPVGAHGVPKLLTPDRLIIEVSKLRKSIQSQVSNQMAYKPSVKNESAKLVPVEIMDVAESIFKALLGETLSLKASSGPKQSKIVASNDEVQAIFLGHRFSKRLRFGACLELTNGLTFLYMKSTSTLKVTGNYSMVK